jgi:excisionase family DNA binding protein
MNRTSAAEQKKPSRAEGSDALAAGEEILTSREARALLKIGRTKLHELTRRQAIPAYRVGSGRTSGLRYRKNDLLEWLYSQKV